ncbi:cytochrome c-type biogenesis protein CcmH [Alteromonas sp. a30]|nr:cytochrome c-type biogenesis protein CcmH [Alteromonas sp. a30]
MSLPIVVLLISGWIIAVAHATETTYQLDDPAKQKIFLELKHELRCPMCQNQTIGDSNAMIALDLKRKTFELVESGKSKQEVIDYMKARYGEFVHYKPPVTPITIWLWLLPAGFIVVAFLVMFFARRNAKSDLNEAGESPLKSEDASPQDLEEADKLLDKYK